MQIELTMGKFAEVDDEDYAMLQSLGNWTYQFCGYARMHKNGKFIYMHRLLMNAPQELEVGHIDGNKLNNKKNNLRLQTTRQNQQGCKKNGSRSLYVGVSWRKRAKPWTALIRFNGKRINLGSFTEQKEAALAYDKAARLFFGPDARVNFPEHI